MTLHAQMDSEHRTLMEWVQIASSRLASRCTAEDALYALDVVRYLACSHFQHERAEMCAADYSGWRAHVQDHQRLIEDLSRLRLDVVAMPASPRDMSRGAFRSRLTSWLLLHVAAYDLPYARWRQERARHLVPSAANSPPQRAGGF